MVIEVQTSAPDNIQSLISDDVDISTMSSPQNDNKIAVAERHAAPMIAHNQDRLLMHNEAGVLMSKDQFAEIFCRLLERYYLDLCENTKSRLE